MPSIVVERVLALLQNVKAIGSSWSARCPAHEDAQNSLSIGEGDDGKALLRCFAGCELGSIVQALGLQVRDLFPTRPATVARGTPLTVDDLAREKRLPREYLASIGLRDRADGVFVFYLPIEGGPAPRQRLRAALAAREGSRWLPGSEAIAPYGLDRLPDARRAGFLVLVEGESDCWTLWFNGFPALGIPGASMTGKIQPEHLAGIPRIYVFREPGQSGDTFVGGVLSRLARFDWKGEILQVSLEGTKDPNDLHKKDPERFRSDFQQALDRAERLDVPEENGPDREIDALLSESGIASLTANTSPAEIEVAVRALATLLAGADELRRAVVREAAIKRLTACDVRSPARILDAALARAADNSCAEDQQGKTVMLSVSEPWPDPVDGAQLLDDICDAVRRFVALGEEAAVAVTLWVIFAYTIGASFVAPILALISPVKRCGKTTLLDVVASLVPRRLMASNITAAALFRTIEHFTPTLLIDEADTFLAAHDELRGILNAGHTRSTAVVIRTVGDSHEPRTFSTWCPKAIALIGRLPATLEDRSIVISLRRKAPGEKLERLRRDRIDRDLEPLRQKATRWANDSLASLRAADPDVPAGIHDRAQDNWRPLLSVADLVGHEWPERARRAAGALNRGEEIDQSARVQLLADLRALFRAKGRDQLGSAAVVESLCKKEERPWAEWSKGRPLTKSQLARLLAPFDVRPKTIRVGDVTSKGYRREDLEDAFARYLPLEPEQPEQAENLNGIADSTDRNTPPAVTDGPAPEKARNDELVTGVTDENREPPAKDAEGEENRTPPDPPDWEEFDA